VRGGMMIRHVRMGWRGGVKSDIPLIVVVIVIHKIHSLFNMRYIYNYASILKRFDE